MDYLSNNITKVEIGAEVTTINNHAGNLSSPDLIQLSDSDCVNAKSEEGYQIMISEDTEFGQDGIGGDCLSNGASVSPSLSSGSESPTPTNSVHGQKRREPQWQTLVSDEHRQLLGTEEDSESHHSSESESEDVWTLTEEQQEYYLKQFITMQPDTKALLLASKAKPFFEKSKLPVSDLSKIWQLADVTRDGALSLEEFYAAMHLVVLRRNSIHIPDVLPQSLYPKAFLKSLESPRKGKNLWKSESQDSSSLSDDRKSIQSNHSIEKPKEIISPNASKEWAKFNESPSNAVTSPRHQPCNFDFIKSDLEKDPKILHPKPLRLTPECNLTDQANDAQHLFNRDTKVDEDDHSIVDGPTISPAANFNDCNCGGSASLSVTIGPPPPPPRSYRNHVRSSSLDLNNTSKLPAPSGPPVPPRISPNTACPQRGVYHNEDESKRLSDVREDSALNILSTAESDQPARNSAFEVYKKTHSDKNKSKEDEYSGTIHANTRVHEKRDLLSSVRTVKEKNAILSRVNSELNQELAEVIEERIALQFQLEQMKPFCQ